MSPKILLWDIETSVNALDAHWAPIICIGYKWLGQKQVTVLSTLDGPGKYYEDKNMIQKFRDILETADIEVTHNGVLFDKPFLQSRLLYKENSKGIPVKKRYLPQVASVDTYLSNRNKFRGSKKLDSLARFMGVKTTKTRLDVETWMKAQRGSKKAIGYLVEHCRRDVLVLEAVYKLTRPMMKGHPVVGLYGDCHSCGSRKMQKRGYSTTVLRGKQVRYQCQSCGGWCQRPERKT
jgi:uncharacterized protein YprB with RNaseH-like and TPR domain